MRGATATTSSTSLNADKPYDQFLREQIAGDVIAPNDPRRPSSPPGFLAAGPWDFVGQVETKSDMLKRAARAGDLDDMVTQVITSTMGITINCARCHDHKLDPISQEEYYRLWSVFAGVKRGERDVDPPDAARRHTAARRTRPSTLPSWSRRSRKLTGEALDLADIVGGGDGRGKGKPGYGFDPEHGESAPPASRASSRMWRPIVFHDRHSRTDGRGSVSLHRWRGHPRRQPHPVPITSTGIVVTDVPRTSGEGLGCHPQWAGERDRRARNSATWTTQRGTLALGLHANAAITFDLRPMHERLGEGALRFSAIVGYGGGKRRNSR